MTNDSNCVHCSRFIFLDIEQLLLLAVLLWPILLSYLLYSNTFAFSWNEGRGSFLIAATLIVVEILGSRPVIRGRKLIILIILAALVSLYFCSLSFGVSNFLLSNGKSLDVFIIESWLWMWDYTILAIYFVTCLAFTFGRASWIRMGGAAILYLIGYCTILFLDVFFPYDTLGIFQFWVPIYLSFNEGILDSINYVFNFDSQFTSQSYGNMLVLHDLDGPFVVKVYWPSAGVHSMIIFSLVMLAFLLKTSIPSRRIFVYFLVGIVGTGAINGVRIFSLSLYAMIVSSDLPTWEAFHSLVGEMIFIPWLALYLASVLYIEKRYQKQILKTKLHHSNKVHSDRKYQ